MNNINPNPYISSETSPVLYYIVLTATIIAAIYLYGIKFDNYTETELVNFSYYFVPAFVFSIIGLITKKYGKSLLYAIAGAIVSVIILGIFFGLIWNSL